MKHLSIHLVAILSLMGSGDIAVHSFTATVKPSTKNHLYNQRIPRRDASVESSIVTKRSMTYLRRRRGQMGATATTTSLHAVGTSTLRAMAETATNGCSRSTSRGNAGGSNNHDSSNDHNDHSDVDMNMLNDLGLPSGLRETLLTSAQDKFSKRIWIIDNSGSMAMLDGHQITLSDGKEEAKKTTDDNDDDDRVKVVTSGCGGSVNSASSATTDGGCADSTTCTRWDEVQETVKIHAQLSEALNAPTDFRLLNKPKNGGPQKFRVGYGVGNGGSSSKGDEGSGSSNSSSSNNDGCGILAMGQRWHRKWKSMNDSKRIQNILSRNKPSGKTALHTCIGEIRNEVINMLPQLQADGMKVAIVIATDGCNHSMIQTSNKKLQEAEMNQELLDALESLQGLPVFVVIRLCTDYGPIVDFYNGLDERVDLSLDVLDDHLAEANEVYEYNPWLNYPLVLHRMREMGQYDILFDLLDERKFTKREIKDFCVLLFGEESFIVSPSTCNDWDLFVAEIDRIQSKERKHWNPRTKELEPWINLEQLKLSLGMSEEEVEGDEKDEMMEKEVESGTVIAAPGMIRGSLFGEHTPALPATGMEELEPAEMKKTANLFGVQLRQEKEAKEDLKMMAP